MGGVQSARKLTVFNEEDIGVIKLSNALAHRLAKAGHATATSQDAGDVKTVLPAPETIVEPKKQPMPSKGDSNPEYLMHYHPHFTLSALEIQQQKEQELLQQEEYWQRRVKSLEKDHEKVNTILDSEYEKAVKEFSCKDVRRTANVEGLTPPCIENSDEVLKCYQQNPKESLKCATLVEEFCNCVDQHRAKVIAMRC